MKLFLLALFIFLGTLEANAYSELSRHGYVNCTACHLSPSGGGLLTPYGRELTRAVVSTWGVKNEQYFAYNSVPALSKNDKLLVGAFLRGLQSYKTDTVATEARAIFMQADVDLAYNSKKWALLGAVGRQELRNGLESEARIFSRRHYGLYRFDQKNVLRIGKFLQFYGLNDPNHQMYVRRYLNFGFDTESYNAEYSFLGDNFSFYLTSVFGNLDKKYSKKKGKGTSASGSYFFGDNQKIGLSSYLGSETTSKRNVFGIWGIFSFHSKVFTTHELDLQKRKIKLTGRKESGFVTSNKINFELIQGLIGFITYDLANLNPASTSSKQFAYGAGINLFPRPHFEFVSAWQREEIVKLKSQSDLFSLVVHFYL